MTHAEGSYYLPQPSHWPLVGSVGLFILLGGFASFLHGGTYLWMILGAVIMVIMFFGWFGKVIDESEGGKYNAQVDLSFRWGMAWFILSEVMFFAAFFGALFYARQLSIPWLGGEGNNAMTNELLWSGFESVWPTNGPSKVGGEYKVMEAWGIPALNTIILLSSGVTVTFAHWALKKQNRSKLIFWLFCTVALGALFVGLQAYEYSEAYTHYNLKLSTGHHGVGRIGASRPHRVLGPAEGCLNAARAVDVVPKSSGCRTTEQWMSYHQRTRLRRAGIIADGTRPRLALQDAARVSRLHNRTPSSDEARESPATPGDARLQE